MLGHGHQDCGGFELHWREVPIIIDPGEGHYGNHLVSLKNISGLGHSGVRIDGEDPSRPTNPYYSEGFRSHYVLEPPKFERLRNSVILTFKTRKYKLIREWVFKSDVQIKDLIEGQGCFHVERNLQMSGLVEIQSDSFLLNRDANVFHIFGEESEALSLHPQTCWSAYGKGTETTTARFTSVVELPWQGTIRLQVGEF